ncbi:MAG: hypothetical protein AAGM38_17805 [Pseudomonadota bacterium]
MAAHLRADALRYEQEPATLEDAVGRTPTTLADWNGYVAGLIGATGAAGASSDAIGSSFFAAVFFATVRKAAVLIAFARAADGKAFQVGKGSFIAPDLVLTNAYSAEAAASLRGVWRAVNETIGAVALEPLANPRRDIEARIDAAIMRAGCFRSNVVSLIARGASW